LLKSKVKSQKLKVRPKRAAEDIRGGMNGSTIKIFFACLLILCFTFRMSAFYEILESNTVKEGGIIKVKIGAERGAKAADIVFLGEKYPAFFKGYEARDREMVYTAMVPVPLDTKGGKKLKIRVLTPSGIEEKTEKISVKKLQEVESDIDTGGKLNDEFMKALAAENKIIHAYVQNITPIKYHLPFIIPLIGEITTVFGASRIYDNGQEKWRHKGVDIAAKEGTPVKASNDGIVAMAARGKAYGNTIIIDHGGGIFTLYFHMQKLFVKRGDKIAKGDVIGAVGATGLATGPHLHFQIDLFKVQVNPNELMAPTGPAWPAGVSRTAGKNTDDNIERLWN
jgi:murein DD-endopeptidase MepM/ murein hydrolase activator NlpD